MPTFYEFQPTLNNMVQQGFVARQLEEGLDSDLAYRRHATEETIDGRIGSIIIIPKVGRKGPVTTPLNPTNFSNLDNGMTPSLPGTETYQYTLSEWGDTEDVDIIGSTVMAADLVTAASRTNGVQAAQSMERLAKIQLHTCYEGGNSWARPDLGGNSISTVHVDDLRGFTQAPVNGVMVPVTSQNPLPCFEMRTSAGGVNQAFNVIGFTVDSPNNSLYPGSTIDNMGNVVSDGVSGVLVIAGAIAVPVFGDAIIAANAAKIVRPFNKPSYNTLNSGDACTLGLVLDMKTRLAQNNVPPMPDGTYHFIHDHAVGRQLFSDQQFLTAYAAQYKSEEYQRGQVFELLGVMFIPTTEAYVQPPTPSVGVNVVVRRSIMIGNDALLQGNYSGLDMYLDVPGMDPIGGVMLVNNVAQIIRPPIDRMLRIVSLTWTWIGSYTCPTDQLATPLIIPTASNATYKRAVVCHTAG